MENVVPIVEIITPEIAKEYLKCNTSNRPVNELHLKRLTEEMQSGNFVFNASSNIVFSEENTLLDGQHRLMACVKSGVSFKTIVARGAAKETFPTIDCGRSRTVSDNFAICEFDDYAKLSSIVQAYVRLTSSISSFSGARGYKSVGVTKKDIIDICKNDYERFHNIKLYADRCVKRMKLMPLSEVGGIMAYLIKTKKHPTELVEKFIGDLFDDERTSPLIKELRRALINDKAAKDGKKMTKHYKTMLIAKTWNAYIRGKEIKMLYWNEEKEGNIEFD